MSTRPAEPGTAPLPAPIAPHPLFAEYYRDSETKHAYLKGVFDRTAGDYDRVEWLLSMGSGRWYRRKALERAGLKAGMRVLDVATGTGLVAREAVRVAGPGGRVITLDPSFGMLSRARGALGLPGVLGVGEALPLAEGAFDFLSMGYALRHLPDLRAAFAEYFRVLKPGGRVCILEITRPAGAVRRGLVKAYFRVLPPVSRLMGTSAETRHLWNYYWETIDQCVPPETVMAALSDAGFSDVKRHMELGLFSEFTATKR